MSERSEILMNAEDGSPELLAAIAAQEIAAAGFAPGSDIELVREFVQALADEEAVECDCGFAAIDCVC